MENPPYLKEDETIEDLQLAGLRLIQKKNAFRYGMDTVLLAHFAEIRRNDMVCDFGTGNGILPLLLIGREKGRVFHAIEIQEEAAELARRNAKLNRLEDRIRVIHGDVAEAAGQLAPCSIDAVITNPPYSQPKAALTSPNEQKATARSQKGNTLDSFFGAAYTLLKGKGKIFLVYPAAQMLHVMKKLEEHHLEPKRIRLVYPNAHKAANLALIEAVKDAKPTLHPMPPMIIYEDSGDLTEELKSVYHME